MHAALAHGQTSVTIGEHQKWPLAASGQATLLEDDTGAMTLDQVAALPVGSKPGFQHPDPSQLSPSAARSTWWLQLSVVNRQDGPLALRLVLGPFNFKKLDVYLQDGSGTWKHLNSGLMVPMSQTSMRSRLPAIPFRLQAGDTMRVLARIVTTQPGLLKPYLYTETGYITRETHMRGWDSLLFGGLLALGWSALMIALFSRNSAFLLLSAEAVLVAGYEAVRRGYGHIYLWPESTEWSYRSIYVLGHLSLAVFLLFVLAVARQEKIRMPARRWFIGFVMFECAMALMSWLGSTYIVRQISAYSTPLFALSVMLAAIALIRQRTPTRVLMLLVTIYAAVHLGLSSLESSGMLPAFLYPKGIDSIGVNPIGALLGFYLNLALLAAWITLMGKQRNAANQALRDWQAQENQRLNAEVGRQTEALNQALEYADDKNRQKTEILSYIGHDLRAPLATIVGYARLLARSPASEHAAHIRAIERSANYQMSLIDELLNYAKSELKPLHLVSRPVEMIGLLHDVIRQAGTLSLQQGNRFHFEISDILPHTLLLDERRLQQALLNLLSNAAKFTHSGTISLYVRAVPAHESGLEWSVDFAVSDTGIGIPIDRQATIFEAFEQEQPRSGSVGLGLFIARSIVRTMGGELQLESAPQQGSTFSFRIVLAATDARTMNWVPPELPQDEAAPAEASVQREAPPAHARLELAVLARDGQLTDIEHWLNHMSATYPQCVEFFREIRNALQVLDLERIENLALAYPA